ncbi:MAG: hypothetical protein Q4G24_06925 [Paracoccus sp. (in: a-proteobacteria)]|uniref:hypothetical protein n=1 Tax=Paracoccus sp. TaxID=267 RepID=UPI0026DFBBDF|nr:hypothetical protein [Paracoccus sp. (in: a-proteobacteria)]MDO5621186.1 hypothetical protein [Paracoccus sp. (in: a-proteobacteria)]
MIEAFENLGLKGGIWSAIVTADAAPEGWHLVHQGQPLAELTVEAAGDSRWLVSVPVPATVLHDGMQTLLMTGPDGQARASLSLLCGRALEPDLRAELDLLRAELDLLKRAFRRQAS